MNQHAAHRVLAIALATTAAVPALAAVTISGNELAQAGNNGSQAVQQSVHATGVGSYTVGPVSGTQGGNSVRADFSIALFPQLALSATATGGEDGTLATNNTLAHVDIDLAYGFRIDGPQDGTPVPLVFTGFTNGTTFFSGNNKVSSRDQVGTAFRVIAPGVGYTFHLVAAGSVGTAGTTYISNGGLATVGWGASAPFTAGYTDYSSSFAYGATLYSGLANAGTMELRLLADGGTSGSAFPPGAPAAGQATAFIDPIISIDTDWLALHPGYSVVVDAGVGNGPVAAVPEPETLWLLLAALPVVAWRKRASAKAIEERNTMNSSMHRPLFVWLFIGFATAACSVLISLPAHASLVMSCPGCTPILVGGTSVIASPTGLPPAIGLSREPDTALPLGQSNLTPLILIPDNTPNGDKLNFGLSVRQGNSTRGAADTFGCDLACLAPTLGLAAEWSTAGSNFLTDYLKDTQPSGPPMAFDGLLAATRAIDPGANGYFVYTPLAGVPIEFGTGSDAQLSFDGLGGFPAGTIIEAFLIDLPSNNQFGGGVSRDATAGALFVGAVQAVPEPSTVTLVLAGICSVVALRATRRRAR